MDTEGCVDRIAAYLMLHATDLDDIETIELRHSVWYSHLMGESNLTPFPRVSN
jgi:hypothetical protein